MTNYTFQSLFDFTRTTSGTFVGSNGLIQTTPASVNLLLQTQAFDNAAWTKGDAAVTANATTAPDGTATADLLTETATTNFHFALQSVTTAAGAATATVYAKLASGSRNLVVYPQGTTVGYAIFNLSTGAITASGGGALLSSSITPAGNGWYRCSVSWTASATSTNFVCYLTNSTTNPAPNYAGDGTSGIFIWGAQLELGSTATTYTRNNGGRFPARFDYDPVTLQPKGILIEEQRTNLATYSEQFDNAAWIKNLVTTTANATASPDGTTNADRVVASTTGNARGVFAPITTTAVAHTVSVFAKAAGLNWLCIYDPAGSGTGGAWFNLATGVVGTVAAGNTATITNFGNGWYRCSIVRTLAAGTSFAFFGGVDGDNTITVSSTTNGIFLYGAQLEAGTFATSYIPTVASQVTRALDICSIVAPNFAPFYNQSEGTFLFEGSSVAPATFAATLNALTASDGTNNNVQRIGRYLNFWFGETRNGNVQEANPLAAGGSYAQNTTAKVAYAYKTNDFAISANGAAAVTDTSGTVPTVITTLRIGGPPIELCGHIRSIRYYPVRLSNAQIQALTA
jgi:hypothetical protein